MTSFVHASTETHKPQAKASYTISDVLQILCITYFTIYTISPPLLVNDVARIAALLAVGLFFVVEITIRPEILLRPTWITVITIVYAVYINIIGYLTDGLSDVVRNFELNVFLCCIIILESYRRRNLEYLKWPTLGVCLASTAWILVTLVAMEGQRNVARIITRTSAESEALMSAGVGGFGLTYFACAMVPVIIYFLRSVNLKPAWLKIPAWIYLGLVSVLVIRSGFFIALLFSAAAAIFAVFYVKGTLKALLQAALALTTVLGLGMLASSQVRDVALELSEGTMYERKVKDAAVSFDRSMPDGTIGQRTERYQRSLKIFSENLFVGVISVQDVGKHSQVLDSLARYGILIGGLLPLAILLVGRELSKRFMETTGLPLVSVSLLLILGLALFNNITMTLGVTAFIIMPAVVHVITRGEREAEESAIIHATGSIREAG